MFLSRTCQNAPLAQEATHSKYPTACVLSQLCLSQVKRFAPSFEPFTEENWSGCFLHPSPLAVNVFIDLFVNRLEPPKL
jgi:hypothetical protein